MLGRRPVTLYNRPIVETAPKPRSGLPLIAGVLLLVAGIGAVIVGLGITVFALGFPGGPSALLGVLAAAFGAAQIVAATGILSGRDWGTSLGISLAVVGVLASLAGLVGALTTSPPHFDDPGVRRYVLPVIPLVVYGVIVWGLVAGRRRGVR